MMTQWVTLLLLLSRV